jgi:hypothetical protein
MSAAVSRLATYHRGLFMDVVIKLHLSIVHGKALVLLTKQERVNK